MRKTAISAALIAFALSSGQTLAQTEKVDPDVAQANSSLDGIAEFDKEMTAAEDNMRRMEAQIEALGKTQDPDARQRLLQEHWDAMQATMRLMQSMHGMSAGSCCQGPMMGGNMRNGRQYGRGEMRRFYFNMTDRQFKEHQYMMEQYMGMQQALMQHMMWHQMMQRERVNPPVNR